MADLPTRMSTMIDLVVVGAGPAGLATAIAAQRAGLAVIVLDKARGPVLDKACGEGLMPDAVAHLRALGVALPVGIGMPLRGIRYCEGQLVASGAFPGLPGLGLRRTTLHAALVARATELGVDLRWGQAVSALLADGVAVGSDRLRAGTVVGADGLHSRLRTWAQLGRRSDSRIPARFGVRRHYATPPWSDHVEIHFGPECEAYVTPVGDNEIGVALLLCEVAARRDSTISLPTSRS